MCYCQSLSVLALSLAVSLSAVSAAPQGPLPVIASGDLSEPPVYAYNYGVSDDESGTQFSQSEQRDGPLTSGSYSVALPDGRTQTVKYTDSGDGVNMEVSYDGVPLPPSPSIISQAPVISSAPVISQSSPIISSPVISHSSPVISHSSPIISNTSPVISHRPILSHSSPVISHRPILSQSSPVISHSPILSHSSPVISHSPILSHNSPFIPHASPIISHAP